MKHFFCLLLLAIPLLLFSQKEVITDSTWISNDSGNFFENHIKIYNTGETDGGYKRLIGDTAAVVEKFSNAFEQQAERFAQDAKVVSEYPSNIRELIRQDDAIEAMLGISPLRTLLQKQDTVFTDTTWSIKIEGSGFVPIVFNVNAGGNLRYTVDTFPTKTAILFGNVIRLNNFLGGTWDEILFKQRDGFYTSLDKRLLLRLTNGSGNRSVAMPSPSGRQLDTIPIPTDKPAKKKTRAKRKRKPRKQ